MQILLFGGNPHEVLMSQDWTVTDVMQAWTTARCAGRDKFYAEFTRLTGMPEADVKTHFVAWTKLKHETAEEVATANGVTIREGGFQAYLTDVLRFGRPRITAVVDDGYDNLDPNPRYKPWPEAEDCPGCDGRAGPSYPHRWGCHVHGGRAGQLVVPVTQGA